jgi:hypothetical protein
MSEDRPDRERASAPIFKVRQIVILIALVFAFALVVRLASGEPLPPGLRDFVVSIFGIGPPMTPIANADPTSK